MENTNQPSPYFIRRLEPATDKSIDLHDFLAVQDQVQPLRDYWLILKRHRWLILTCALTVFIGATLYTFTRTPLYTAEATLLIERRAPQILKLQDARPDGMDYNDYNNEFYKTQYEILKSGALAGRVVRDEGLEKHPLFGGGGKSNAPGREGLVSGLWQQFKKSGEDLLGGKTDVPKPNTEHPTRNNENPTSNIADPIPLSTRLAGQYLSMVEIRPVAGTSLVVIKVTTPDSALSARLANAHASSYVRYGMDLRSQTNTEAGEFLQQKLTELKERVEESEAALNSYRKEKGIISIDDKSNVVVDRLVDLNKALTAAEGERISWEAQVRAARGRSAEEIPSVRNSPMIGSLKKELGGVEAEYASLAKEFKPGYPPLDNLRARMDENRRRIAAEVDREVKSIEAGYAAASNKESQLRAALDEQKQATLNLKDSAVQYAILAREVDTNKQLYDGVLSRLKEIGVAAEVRSTNIYVMGKALPPGGPSYPDKRRAMMLGVLFGLAAGVGLAFLLEQLDNTLKTAEEAERYLRLPNLGLVPDFGSVNTKSNGFVSRLVYSAQAELSIATRNGSKDSSGEVLLDHDPRSLVAEAYRTFRSAMLLSQAGGPPHTLLITSAARGDGKSTTVVNTAIVFAQLGIRVVVVDADLRRPRCHMLLKTENNKGVSDILAGQLSLDQAIKTTSTENLFLITAGTVPPNPAELLGSQKMHDLLMRLSKEFEFVFVDSSPVLAVSDSVFLSTMVDGTLFVVSSKTPKPLIRKARARLSIPQTKIIGMLLNRIDVHNHEYSGYYQQYYAYYGHGRGANKFRRNGNAVASQGNGNGASHHDTNSQSPPATETQPSSNGLASRLAKALSRIAPTAVYKRGSPAAVSSDGLVQAASEQIGERSEIMMNIDAPNTAQRVNHTKEQSKNAARIENAADASVLSEPTKASPSTPPAEPVKEIARPAISNGTDIGLPPEFISVVKDKLLRAMGPMAPLIVCEQLRALGLSADSFSKSAAERFTKALAKEISDDYHRDRFENEVGEEISKLKLGANAEAVEEYVFQNDDISEPVLNNDSRNTRDFLQLISGKLVEAMGPMAPLILREHIVALGRSPDSFPESDIEDLISHVSGEIPRQSARRQFEKEMARELRTLKAGSGDQGTGSRKRKSAKGKQDAGSE